MVDQGPSDSDPVTWTLYFKEGGVGTFVPFFIRFAPALLAE
jgi:hypothetical protein